MKYEDIAKEFTKVVNDYLNDGWVLDLDHMGGSQSNIKAAVPMKKDGVVAAVYIKRSYIKYMDIMSIHVEFFGSGSNRVLFYGTSDELYSTVAEYVEVGRGNDWYVTPDEYTEIRNKRFLRRRSKDDHRKAFTSDNAKAVAYKIAKSTPGCKRIKPDWVESITKVANGDKYGSKWRIIVWTNFNNSKARRRIINIDIDTFYGMHHLVKDVA